MKVWQVATGEPGRDYRELFFAHDLMMLGPVHQGSAESGQYASGPANSAYRQVHSFAHQPAVGDRVLMRFGGKVIGLGEIPDHSEAGYSFDHRVGAVYGWELHHLRRVKWATDIALGPFDVGFSGSRQPSFSQVHESNLTAAARAVDPSHFGGDLNCLPTIDTKPYTEEELGVELFRAGVGNKNIEDILAALRQAERLCSWYWTPEASGRYPTEHEVVSHIVLPLFLGLGWSHQQIAVEWNRVDMAFFKRTPTKPKNCVMVLEAKGLGRGLSDVRHQAQRYVDGGGLTEVRLLVTTDGANLFVYERSGTEVNAKPAGYLNVSRLQRAYLLPSGTDLVNTLVRLQPGAV